MNATALDHELVPAGDPDAHHDPLMRECGSCGASLHHRDHDERCPERATIYRLNVRQDPRVRHLEDLLQACTRRAAAQRRSP